MSRQTGDDTTSIAPEDTSTIRRIRLIASAVIVITVSFFVRLGGGPGYWSRLLARAAVARLDIE